MGIARLDDNMTLDDLPLGQGARIVAGAEHHAHDAPSETLHRLHEIGFVDGESVAVLVRGVPGGDPLVVRVGASRFALRRSEAQLIAVASA